MEEKRQSLYESLSAALDLPQRHVPARMNALSLAYLGDTIYDLYVRTSLVEAGDHPVRELHRLASGRVCAKAQAAACRRIAPLLSGEEAEVLRRGRNAHMGTVPKNASIADYRMATGLEALLGYLYLTGRDGRLGALMRLILEEEEEEIHG